MCSVNGISTWIGKLCQWKWGGGGAIFKKTQWIKHWDDGSEAKTTRLQQQASLDPTVKPSAASHGRKKRWGFGRQGYVLITLTWQNNASLVQSHWRKWRKVFICLYLLLAAKGLSVQTWGESRRPLVGTPSSKSAQWVGLCADGDVAASLSGTADWLSRRSDHVSTLFSPIIFLMTGNFLSLRVGDVGNCTQLYKWQVKS